MASGLMRWVAALTVCGAAVAWGLLPPGKLVDRFWAMVDRENAFMTPAMGEVDAARRELDRRLRAAHYWDEADALRPLVTAAMAEGRTEAVLAIDPERVSEARSESACVPRRITLGETVSADMDSASCVGERSGPEDRFALPVEAPGVYVVRVGTRRYVSIGVDRDGAHVDAWQPGRFRLYFIADRAGEYTVTVEGSRFRDGTEGAYTVDVDRAGSAGLEAGVSTGSELDPDVAYRLDLSNEDPRVVTVMGGAARVSGGTIVAGPRTALVYGGEHLFVSDRVGVAGTAVHVYPPLRPATDVLGSDEVEWSVQPGEVPPVWAFDVEGEQLVEVAIRRQEVGGGQSSVRWLGAAPGGPFDAATPLAAGRYRVTADPGQVAEAPGRRFTVRVRCAAAVVPAALGTTTEWSGPESCRADRTDRTAWRVVLERPTVFTVAWEGQGDVTARPVGRPIGDLDRAFPTAGGRFALEAGTYLLEGTGGAARSITLHDLGTPEDFLSRRVAGIRREDGGGSAPGARAMVGLAFGPEWPVVGGIGTIALRSETSVHAGEASGRPFCVQVHHARSATALASASEATDPGVCRYWARYGPPGAAMRGWLEAGGAAFALRDADDGVWTHPRFRFQAGDDVPFADLLGVVTTEGGLRPDAEACLQGLVDRCDAAWSSGTGEPGRDVPLPGVGADDQAWAFYGAEGTLLADLERAFGPEAFALFWGAEASLSDAFERAFGTSRGAWTHEWAVERLGPRPARGSILAHGGLSLLVCGLLGMVAGGACRRRQTS